ncbi:EF-hand domain-containing protein [Henriciella sp.]|uniref:EF-hand domain-containing protein n=1 Tax=Henriciella sp. TaxID=1968823 RepID=UPI002625119A|nr:EF-hand domain-containing protein [Henriciella sp.]
MKRIAIFAAAAATGAFAASAGEMAAFSDIDTDADGMITETEFVAHKTADGEVTEQEASDKFAKIDADFDGSITEAEMTAAKEQWKDKEAGADAGMGMEAETEMEGDTSY